MFYNIFMLLIIIFVVEIKAQDRAFKFFQVPHDTLNYNIYLSHSVDHYLLKKDDNDKSKPEKIKKLNLQEFQNAISKLYNGELTGKNLVQVSSMLFTQIIQENVENEIRSRLKNAKFVRNLKLGTLSFKNKNNNRVHVYEADAKGVKIYYMGKMDWLCKDISRSIKKHWFEVSSVEIAFEDGHMKDILATGKFFIMSSRDSTFNIFSINDTSSIITIIDTCIIDTISVDAQFRNSSFPPLRKPSEISDLNSSIKNKLEFVYQDISYKIYLSDLIFFKRNVIFATGSYIPATEVVAINWDGDKEIGIYKKEFDDNFDLRVYTDVTGFQENNPNGLLQFEGNLDLIITTSSNRFVFFNNISPYVTFSKLENKLNNLTPTIAPLKNENILSNSRNFASTIDFMRYKNLDIGITGNILTWSFPAAKLKINSKFGLLRSSIDSSAIYIDSIQTDLKIRNVLLSYFAQYLNVKWINDDNLSIDLGIGHYLFRLFDEDKNISISGTKNIWKFHLGINIFTNPKDSFKKAVFFRGTFITDSIFRFNNLLLQTGYSTPITNLF